jgi:hypothetical protein
MSPLLLDTPAAVRFISAEPLLGPIDLTRLCILPQKPGSVRAGIHLNALAGRYCESGMPYLGAWDINGPCPPATEQRHLDWVISGGESGPHARPMHPDWARSQRDQCKSAGVPFFFKQWGNWMPDTPAASALQGSVVAWPDGSVGRGHSGEHGGLGTIMFNRGKHRAGRLLDGIEYNAMPERSG